MNISYLKNSWIRFYKRGFMTGLLIMSFILVVDQFLANPLFFSKITSFDIFLFILSTIFFGSPGKPNIKQILTLIPTFFAFSMN